MSTGFGSRCSNGVNVSSFGSYSHEFRSSDLWIPGNDSPGPQDHRVGLEPRQQVPEVVYGYPTMDGENNGKPYEQMDVLWGKTPIFGNTHVYLLI